LKAKNNMLKNVEKVDWINVHGAYGTAQKFPQWLNDLASSDERIRQDARANLNEYCFHQQSIYEATPYVVPFLIELLEIEAVADKDALLNMLAAFYGAARMDETWYHQPWGNEDDFVQRVKKSRLASENTRLGIRAGVPIYIRFLNDNDSEVRKQAALLLGMLRPDAIQLAPLLCQRILIEEVAEVKATAIESLRKLILERRAETGMDVLPFTTLLEALLHAPEHNVVRLEAARTLAQLLAPNIPAAVLEILADALIHPMAYSFWPPDTVVAKGILEDVSDCLYLLGADRYLTILANALPLVTDPEDAHELAVRLLDLLFIGHVSKIGYSGNPRRSGDYISFGTLPDGYLTELEDNSAAIFRHGEDETQEETRRWRGQRLYPKATSAVHIQDLSVQQREFLHIIVNTDILWMIHSNLLEMYGLPASRSQVRQLLANA
jgi:hypothetical protein